MKWTGKRLRLAVGFLAASAVFSLAGCSLPNSNENTTVSVNETGSVTENIVEAKGNEDYTEDDLKQYIENAIADYGSSDEKAVRMDSCSVDSSTVTIKMTYASMEDYSNFNHVTAFHGTLAEAEKAGYSMDQNFLDRNGNAADPDVLASRAKEWKVVILSEPVMVRLPDKILYATDNVSITGRLSATIRTVLSQDGSGGSAASGSSGGESVTSGSAGSGAASSSSVSSESGGAAASSGQGAGTDLIKDAGNSGGNANKSISRLVTVSDRYAYIIYK
ncbi:MAG: hypothetical protein ACOYBD_08965 [Bilifractor sp.]|jgi:hypothetical protein